VATLLSERFEVTGFDKQPPHYDYKHPFNTATLDLSDASKIESALKGFDTVVSALPLFSK
jgi:putative NADH-flavin reductase